MSDGYNRALVAAGCTVIDFEVFGSYQGEWLAQVVMPSGDVRFIKGYYGSCSGCDAFEAEFGFDSHYVEDHDGKSTYHSDYQDAFPYKGCEKCDAWWAKLKKFGEGYLDDAKTAEQLAKDMLDDSYWSSYDGDYAVAAKLLPLVRVENIRTALQARIDKKDA